MKIKRYISVLLSVLLFISASVFPMSANAEPNMSGHDNVQKYFLRTIGSLARADYYKTDVLASITVSQALLESGWGRASLPVGGKNLFGIMAFQTWNGWVYDQNESILYESYQDILLAKGQNYMNTVSMWRAHETWAQSVECHSSLFLEESKYYKVVGEKNYKIAAQEIVNAGYCSDDTYAPIVIQLIERYELTDYDDLTPDSDGIVAIIAKDERVNLNSGEQTKVELITYPAEKTPSSLVWKSDNEAVATVDQEGNVTAVSHGMTLISATLANGREACCIVYVDSNATVMNSNIYIRTSPSSNAPNLGRIAYGMPIKVTSNKIFTDESGNRFYEISGYNTSGTLVSGYGSADCIYLNERYVSGISVVKDDITLVKGDKYEIVTAVYPTDAVDADISWTSSNKNVATVDDNGVITAVANGSAVITASASGGTKKEIKVTVASSEREYKGIVSSYTNLTVRSQPDSSSSNIGRINFLEEVTVIGEPFGLWYKIKGKNPSGVTITGYVHSAYVRLVKAGEKVVYGTAPAGVKLYETSDTSSFSYGTLAEGSTYCAIGDTVNGWSYLIGLKNPSNLKAIYGYGNLTPKQEEDIPGTPDIPDVPGGTLHYYGRTNTSLKIREGAGTEYEQVAIIPEYTRIIISGDAENGWYKVTYTDEQGKTHSGYSSAEYITVLYVGVIEATALNVRIQPTTGATIVGKFDNGDKITLIGSASNGWYAVEGKDATTGNIVTGYCSADYISVSGKLPAEVEEEESGLGLNNSKLEIKDGILYGVSANTKVSVLLQSFNGNVSVYNSSGKALSADDLVGTGSVIKAAANGTVTDSATIIVMGDVNGDGTINPNDYALVKRTFLGTYSLSGIYLDAALVSKRGELNVADYAIIKRVVLGTYTLA